MKRLLLVVCCLLGAGVTAHAQTTSASQLAWDQGAANLATAQGLTYRYYADGSATPVTLSGVTCTGSAAPFVCTVAFPAFTPGAHTLQLAAANVAGESAKSLVLSFTFVVIPDAPANLRIQ